MYVTMLGISGSGKTSYMSGLYEALAAEEVNGFRIESTSASTNIVDDVLALGDFDSISFSGRKFKFPPSTQKTTLWSFDLLHQQSLVSNFHWIDYRGGILTDTSDEIRGDPKKLQELNELTVHIQFTNAVLIFIDSIALTRFEDLREARRRSGVDKIVSLMLQIDKAYPNRNLTYVIVLTKADAVEEKWKLSNYDKLVRRGLEAFDRFIVYGKTKPMWTGGIVPISAVGENNAETKIIMPPTMQDDLVVTSTLKKMPAPMYIGDAIFFAVGQTLKRNAEATKMELAQQQRDMLNTLKKTNWLKSLWAKITNQPTPEEIVKTLFEQQQANAARLQQFERFIKPLLDSAYKGVRLIQGW
jgi:hypothetical protein